MVTLARTPRLVSGLQWYALLGPPLSWTVQLVLGYYTTQAACGLTTCFGAGGWYGSTTSLPWASIRKIGRAHV